MLLNIDYFQSVYSVCRFFWIRLSTLFFYLIFFIMLIPVKPGVRFREIGEVINRHALMSGFSVVTYNPRTLFSLYIYINVGACAWMHIYLKFTVIFLYLLIIGEIILRSWHWRALPLCTKHTSLRKYPQ